MLKNRLAIKLISLLLLMSLCSTSCDVPDISKFSETSTEMTSGIRTTVKETENNLKTLVEKKELFNEENQENLALNLKNYQKAIKPTLKTLDSLDSYLESLNALSQANKKSEENSKAVVSSVSNLVTAVSGIQLAGTTINIVTGLVTLGEQFRTSKNFKTRVNIAANIVEGRYREELTYPIVNGEQKESKVMKKICTNEVDSNDEIIVKVKIENISKRLDGTLETIKNYKRYSAKEKEILVSSAKENADKEVYKLGCGVIDLLKFTLQDLKPINYAALTILNSNYKENNNTVIDFYDGIVVNDKRIQSELSLILQYKNLVSSFRETYIYNNIKPPANKMNTIRNTLDSIFFYDGQLKSSISDFLKGCNKPTDPVCGDMKKFLTVEETELANEVHAKIDFMQWDRSVNKIEEILDTRASVLFKRNKEYLDDLSRLEPSHKAVMNELKSIKDKQEQMDNLIDTNIEALDAWSETHANLRIAMNTKKPLTATRLASKVKEIWAIINPEK